MTIRRQYQLPNCSLILDGLSIDPAPGNEDVMSLLVNAECRISGLERSINGGFNFFAARVRAVSQYRQELLSGCAHPQVGEGEPLLVHINPGDGPYHHLVVQPEIADLGGTGDGRAIDIKLSAVQLFDLTEAVDQFFGDRQTLPELEPSLSPLPRRFVRTEEPLSDRAIPAVLGVGGLVAAAMAFGLLPIPDMRDPAFETRRPGDEAAEVSSAASSDSGTNSAEPPTADNTSDDSGTEVATASLDETDSEADSSNGTTVDGVVSDSDDSNSQATLAATDESEDAGSEDADSSAENVAASIDEADSTDSPNSNATASNQPDSDSDEVETAANTASQNASSTRTASSTLEFEAEPATNTRSLAAVERLNAQLKRTIVDNREQPRFGNAVSYRVRYYENGTIAGFEPVDSAARSAVDETPLPGLVDAQPDEGDSVDYRVVFTERGVVEVSPWWGWSFYE